MQENVLGREIRLIASIGAIRWGTQVMRPPTLSDSGDIIWDVTPHCLCRYRNILVSHQAAPLTFYNKIALMIVRTTYLCLVELPIYSI